jgi:nucleotide-binding universal stress UspA family protein
MSDELSNPGPIEQDRSHVVVGHDGHPAAQAALAASIELARRLDAQLHVVHSITHSDYGIDPDTDEFEETCRRNLAHERDQIAGVLDDAGVAWSYHEERGDPAARLMHLANETDADYIVVGATHRGWLHLGGSVPKRLLHMQTRPVLVVPDPHGLG